jgi:hypothetical protein
MKSPALIDAAAPDQLAAVSDVAGGGAGATRPRVHQPDQGTDYPSLRAIVEIARDSVEGCHLASGTLIRDAGAEVAEASEPLAAELDRAEREFGEGPGLQACDTSSIVTSNDLGTDARWPFFGPLARRRGVAAVMSVPLTPVREVPGWCGWLTLYNRRPGPFSPSSIALAETLGLYCSSSVNSELHARSLHAALVSRDLIGQAKGILMARKGIDNEQAFAILLQASQHANRRLHEVAEIVVRSCDRHGIVE